MRNTRSITRILTVTAVTGLLAAASLTAAVPASAADAGDSATSAETPTDERLRERAATACERVPVVIDRTVRMQERLAGDEDTRGSIARLTERVEEAESRGNAERAERLRARLDIRTERAELLVLRLEALESARETCAEAGL